MAEAKFESNCSLGFVTVRQHSEHGYFGGLLIVNQLGRPLEFHCTLPVKPSRAQAILFGQTLDDFLCGEQIAKALLCKAKITPRLIFTDCSAVLAVHLVSDYPVALIHHRQPDPSSTYFTLPKSNSTATNAFALGKYQVAVPIQAGARPQLLANLWDELKPELDLFEPFERICEALLEAHPIARAA